MNDLLKKYWTSLLGAAFILIAFSYFFEYSIEQGWLTDDLKIGFGLLAGAALIIAGNKLISAAKSRITGEMASGLGFAALYTTFSFAGIYFALWTPMTVFLCMLAVTCGICAYAVRFHLRLLMNIGLIGALISPLVLRPEGDQVFTLFLYLLVVNSGYFALSLHKGWIELRPVAFTGTWLLYTVYFFHFDPVVSGVWSLPYRYATAAFVFYVLSFAAASWRDRKNSDGVHLYMGIANAVLFGLWSISLLGGVVSVSAPLALMGLLYLGTAAVLYHLTGKMNTAVTAKLAGGALLLLIAASRLGSGHEMKPLISVYVWGAVAILLLIAGELRRIPFLKAASVFTWLTVGSYWYAVTWDTPRGEWFGVFLPFLNWGALSWMLLAVIGFYYSIRLRFDGISPSANAMLSNVYAVLSHLIVGGLLSVQIESMFSEYRLGRVLDESLSLSIVWGVYALLLFLWGAYSRQKLFRAFGSAVLVLVALKTLLLDLAGGNTIYRVIALLVLGCISFAITYINNRWMSKEQANGTETGGAGTAASSESDVTDQ